MRLLQDLKLFANSKHLNMDACWGVRLWGFWLCALYWFHQFVLISFNLIIIFWSKNQSAQQSHQGSRIAWQLPKIFPALQRTGVICSNTKCKILAQIHPVQFLLFHNAVSVFPLVWIDLSTCITLRQELLPQVLPYRKIRLSYPG